ncbi:sulfurtransferase [Microbacterium sp.]|uniref:sulfurtransferase n=1 Tax=Microbacterium sp. TaxID=51671 RepID=UPI0039E27D85
MTNILIDAEQLGDLVGGGAGPRLLDVRWRLDRPDGRPDFIAGHIPGAVYVDLDAELASHGRADEGRHPLPRREDLQESVRRWGINDGDTVVVYDDLGSMSAARAWWVLTDAGLDVRLLDGGLGAWTSAGLPLETGEVVPARGAATLTGGLLPRLTIDEAAALPDRGVLLDARAAERYRGDVEPIDPRAGHIPGAVSLPTAGNIDASGRFLPPDVLRRRFEHAGAGTGEVGVYCGSGVTASHAYVALTIAGFSPRLYPGSWSQWSNIPDRPVATGSEPGGAPSDG